MLRAARDAAAVARTELHAHVQTFRSGDAAAGAASDSRPDSSPFAASDARTNEATTTRADAKADATPNSSTDLPTYGCYASAYQEADARAD